MRFLQLNFQRIFPKNKLFLSCFWSVFVLFAVPADFFAQATTVDVGLRFEQKKGETYPVVSQVWKFSSAEDEGIRTGEILWSLDGASVEGLKPQEVLSRLSGKEGDKHTLLVGKDKREVKVKLRRLKGKCASGDCSTGRGVWDEPDARYEGDFVKGKFEGRGVMTYLSGNRHEGGYRDGKREGQGKYFFSTGTVYVGNFSKNNFNGRGTLKYKTGETYEGEFLDDERNGEGVATWPNGDRYEGLWSGDLRNGQGLMVYADGSKYDGAWKEGKRDGFGRMISFEGWSYEGNWSNDLRHGYGKLKKKSGERIEGVFQNDQLPLDPVTSSGDAEPMPKPAELPPAPVELNREEASFMASSNGAPAVSTPQKSILESQAISDFLQNGVSKNSKMAAYSSKNSAPEAVLTGALRPGGTKNLPTSATRKMPPPTNKDGGKKLRQVKVLDGFFDNAAAADTWLVDNERIATRTDRAENLKGLSIMTATWAASAKNNLEVFGKDLDLPAREKAAEICDKFLSSNSLLAEKYMQLANLLAVNIGVEKGPGDSPQIQKVRREIAELWPQQEMQYLTARNLFF